MSGQQIGLLIAGMGLVLVVLGLLVWAGGLSWFGNLPGDIRIEGERTRVYIPVTSMLLISVMLSLLLFVLRKLL